MIFDFRSRRSHLARGATALGAWSTRHATAVLLGLLLITAGLAPLVAYVGYDDDVIQFLPQGDPEVTRFREIGARFGGLSVGLVGVEATDGDLFTPQRVALLRELTLALRTVPGVSYATSITELNDVIEGQTEDGEPVAVVSDLVEPLPGQPGGPPIGADRPDSRGRHWDTAEDWASDLRGRVLSRRHVAGDLVSLDGTSALVLATLDPSAPQRATAEAIRARADQIASAAGLPIRLYFGGAPFIGAYVADGAERDLRELSPWVALAIVLIVFATSRSLIGASVALASVGVGIVWLMALMAVTGRPLTLVSSSLPVLLVALGSAYSIHLLTRTLAYLDAGETDQRVAALRAVQEVAPPILVAGLTTALGFLSFLVMDIRPMREFGLWMSAGTILVVLLALIVVPAACTRFPLRAREAGRAPAWASRALARLATVAVRHPRWATALTIAVLTAGSVGSGLVATHMETRRLFEADSEPVVAEEFLQRALGGSLYLQIEVTGPIRHPLALRQVERLADLAAAEPGVAGVQSVATPMVLATGAMTGLARIPTSAKTARAVAALVDDDPNVRMLVDATWEHALVQVKLGGFDTKSAGALASRIASGIRDHIEGARVAVPRGELTEEQRAAERADVARHVLWILRDAGYDQVTEQAVLQAVRSVADVDRASLAERVRKAVRQAVYEDEIIYLADGADIEPLVQWLVDQLLLPPAEDAAARTAALVAQVRAIASAEELENADGLNAGSVYLWEQAAAESRDLLKTGRAEGVLALVPEVAGGNSAASAADLEYVRGRIEAAVAVLADPWAALPAELAAAAAGGERREQVSLEVAVSGYPMVYAGMNASVHRNQTFSLLVASGLVFLALAWFFRSVSLAFATALPAGLTLLFIFGIMGFSGIPMDVGTSMIASIALGVGLDYAVHLMWHLGEPGALQDPGAATAEVGWGIAINAAEVAAGFAILVFGTIVPMRNFGMLTATAMVVSALATIALVPAMARVIAARARAKKREILR